tara:strand:- start:2225 stop:2689 length:465 start_codon:yes stop_codon:yes gene_type:complete
MKWTFYRLDSLPADGSIVWCKYPHREAKGHPGPTARPVLVRKTSILSIDGEKFGTVDVSYGTGEFNERHREIDLVIGDMRRARDLGLHKPTRFSLDSRDRKNLPWCEEFFVAPSYVRGCGIVLGRIGEDEITRLKACLEKRRLTIAANTRTTTG